MPFTQTHLLSYSAPNVLFGKRRALVRRLTGLGLTAELPTNPDQSRQRLVSSSYRTVIVSMCSIHGLSRPQLYCIYANVPQKWAVQQCPAIDWVPVIEIKDTYVEAAFDAALHHSLVSL